MNAELREPADLQRLFDLAPVGLCVSSNRVIRLCNEAFAAMFGYRADELVGQSLELLYPSRQEFERIGARGLPIMQATGAYSDHRIMRRRSGDLFWCHVSGRAPDRADPFAYAVWAFEDISKDRPVSVHLTRRERDIAALLATGKTSKQIGKELGISPRTVELYRARLLRKYDARTPGELIARLSILPY
jgi:PAS domain S-box-containing protein